MGPKLAALQLAATQSAGLVENIEPILQAQAWLLYQLRLVDEQIAGVEDAITNTLETWPRHHRAVLDSLPCMSIMRQAVLLSAIGDLSTFHDDRQLRKFLGWYPELRESGSSTAKHRMGRSGNRLARRELWLWSIQLLAPACPPSPFRSYYHRLRERGIRGQVAIGHVAGKLISVLFFCMRRGQLYDPERHGHDLGLSDACSTSEA